jgi:hypothetical protein
MELRVQRQRLEIEPRRRNVFAEIPGTNVEARLSQCIEQFARDEVDLPQVWCPRLSARQISVPDKLAVVGVAFDPISRRENNGEPRSLAEPMLGIERYGDDRSPQTRLFSEVVRGAQLGGCPFEANEATVHRDVAPVTKLASSLARKTIRDALLRLADIARRRRMRLRRCGS